MFRVLIAPLQFGLNVRIQQSQQQSCTMIRRHLAAGWLRGRDSTFWPQSGCCGSGITKQQSGGKRYGDQLTNTQFAHSLIVVMDLQFLAMPYNQGISIITLERSFQHEGIQSTHHRRIGQRRRGRHPGRPEDVSGAWRLWHVHFDGCNGAEHAWSSGRLSAGTCSSGPPA
ncbi:hypothetical protein D3C71_1443730 [compost metagenome]